MDMNNTSNFIVKGIEDAEFHGFLNEYLGSDCHSFILVRKNGKFFAYELKYNFTPKFMAEYGEYSLEINGCGVEVKVRKDGTWGHWVIDKWLGESVRTASGRLKKSWVGYGFLHEYSH